MNRMRKTKIVCTLGPSTDREDVLRDMILSGMNVARFNFSHGTHEEHKRRLDTLKRLREELNQPVAALLDTKGPEIRLKQFAGGKTELVTGQTFTLTTRDVEGTNEICSIPYKDLPGDRHQAHRHRHHLQGGERRPHQQQQGRERARRFPVHALHEPAGQGRHPLRHRAGL